MQTLFKVQTIDAVEAFLKEYDTTIDNHSLVPKQIEKEDFLLGKFELKPHWYSWKKRIPTTALLLPNMKAATIANIKQEAWTDEDIEQMARFVVVMPLFQSEIRKKIQEEHIVRDTIAEPFDDKPNSREELQRSRFQLDWDMATFQKEYNIKAWWHFDPNEAEICVFSFDADQDRIIANLPGEKWLDHPVDYNKSVGDNFKEAYEGIDKQFPQLFQSAGLRM